VAAVLYVGVFAGAVAYIAYFGLLDTTGAIRANLVFYGVPAVATLGGWALLGETVTSLTLLGFLTVFAGFAVIGSESVAVRDLLASPARSDEEGGDSYDTTVPSD